MWQKIAMHCNLKAAQVVLGFNALYSTGLQIQLFWQSVFRPYSHCTCPETDTSEFPLEILTLPFMGARREGQDGALAPSKNAVKYFCALVGSYSKTLSRRIIYALFS